MIQNLVLEVVVQPEQLALLEPLQRIFSRIFHYRHDNFEYHVLVVADKGQRCGEQLRFLRDNGLTYIDLATQRERLVNDFFSGVLLQNAPIKRIAFYDGEDDPTEQRIEISNGFHTQLLMLPPFWHFNPFNR